MTNDLDHTVEDFQTACAFPNAGRSHDPKKRSFKKIIKKQKKICIQDLL